MLGNGAMLYPHPAPHPIPEVSNPSQLVQGPQEGCINAGYLKTHAKLRRNTHCKWCFITESSCQKLTTDRRATKV